MTTPIDKHIAHNQYPEMALSKHVSPTCIHNLRASWAIVFKENPTPWQTIEARAHREIKTQPEIEKPAKAKFKRQLIS
jgi:hypothetical protein